MQGIQQFGKLVTRDGMDENKFLEFLVSWCDASRLWQDNLAISHD